jgi:soluble lytic murein transglycosylase-like protein
MTGAVLAALLRSVLLVWLLGGVVPARACWDEVGTRYGISPYLLYAIARTESGLDPAAVNRSNANGSVDVGLMQINSAWFPALAANGITPQMLLDPCTNLEAGAWILAQNIRRLGYSWEAVGAYNAASADKRLRYARSVYRNLPPALQDPQ